jgi:S-adenosylmethionine:tRNA ribosyltransferase-isomerase
MTTPLPLSDYDFPFPEELIASEAAEPRDSSKLMVVDRATGALDHRIFRDLPDLLSPGDCVVVNKTKVFSCRLMGKKSTGGKADMLLVKEMEPGLWAALASGFKRGGLLEFPGGLTAVIEGLTEDGEYLIRFSTTDLLSYFETHGMAPLPPYISKKRPAKDSDRERYQTVYAEERGSIAAPTAGLHFTPQVFERLKAKGIETAHVTLHVGRGTFRPIQSDDAAAHKMLAEWFKLDAEDAARITAARAAGKRVVSVGTTSTRTLETLAARPEGLGPGTGWTSLYITPGHQFRAATALLTNFHLPKSTPLLLASAFLGRDKLLAAYQEAFRLRYRLYSFGDAMLVL